MKEFNEIIKSINYNTESFEGFKYTEILYCKLDWLKQGIIDIEEYVDIIIEIQNFIEKLQKLENG